MLPFVASRAAPLDLCISVQPGAIDFRRIPLRLEPRSPLRRRPGMVACRHDLPSYPARPHVATGPVRPSGRHGGRHSLLTSIGNGIRRGLRQWKVGRNSRRQQRCWKTPAGVCRIPMSAFGRIKSALGPRAVVNRDTYLRLLLTQNCRCMFWSFGRLRGSSHGPCQPLLLLTVL